MSVLIKNGRIVTAADDYVADVFVDGERISLIGASLDVAADKVVDASGRYVLPGCVDPHTHLDMPFGGTVTIDDVESGQTAAAFGGTTCHVDFVIQGKGQSFAAALEDWHAKREGKAVIDNGYHMAVTDLVERRHARGARLAARPGRDLVQALHGVQGRADGRRRDPVQDDGGRGRHRRARDGARRERRRDRRAREAGARGRQHRAALPRAHAPARARGRGDEPRDPARPHRRLAALRRPRLVQGVGRPDRDRAREGLGRPRRDVHAVLLQSTTRTSSARLRGREVGLHAAAARQGEPGGALGRRPQRHPLGDLDRPLRVHLAGAEDDGRRRLLEDPERRPGARGPAPHDPRVRRPPAVGSR